MKRTVARIGVVATTGALAAVLTALPASAHVVTDPDTASQGSFTKIAFRVPNESDTAGTVKLEVNLPADHPITSVQTTPVPGWTAQTVKAPLDPPVQDEGRTITEAPRSITWTAVLGTRINPGEFVDFDVSMGPLPTNADQLVMPAVQTYDDGTVVAWDAPPAATGQPEPEHPAPALTLTPAPAGAMSTMHGATPEPAATTTTATADTTARWLGGIAIALGVIAVATALTTVLRSRRARPPS